MNEGDDELYAFGNQLQVDRLLSESPPTGVTTLHREFYVDVLLLSPSFIPYGDTPISKDELSEGRWRYAQFPYGGSS